MLTISQVAEQFGVDASHVSKWCKNGTFPNAVKETGHQHNRWLIPEEDVEAYAATRSKRFCERCDKAFSPKDPKTRYCSEQCRRAAESRRQYTRKRAAGLCAHCMKVPAADGYVMCDECRTKNQERNRAKTRKQRDREIEWKRNWLKDKPGYYQIMHDRTTAKVRRQVFNHYGDRCTCCGLEDWRFLTIDHIDGKGNQHRRETFNGRLVAGVEFYRWLRKNNYPEGFQLLCYNCNCAQSRFMGICPHKLPLDESQSHSTKLV